MKCVILQPSYIPWRGYFHQIQKADVFIFYDDVQYDKHGWRNRNKIRTANGTQWLTIPVKSRGAVSEGLRINEVLIDQSVNWAVKHARSIQQVYAKAPYFREYWPKLEAFYQQSAERLVDVTIPLTICLSELLGIRHTTFVRSSDLGGAGSQTERLVSLLKSVGATHYISGPSAREYLDEAQLEQAGIGLEYMTYTYSEYPQLHTGFEAGVTVLDLLFMTGPQASSWIWDRAGSASIV